MNHIRPALGITVAALLLTGCGTAPEDAGYDFGNTLDPLPGVALLDGTSAGQRGACAVESVERYEDDTDQDAFMKGCLDGARRR